MNHTELLDRIEMGIAVHGLTPHERDLAALADAMTRMGVKPSLAGIIGDPAAPEPARLRAFGRALAAFRSLPPQRLHSAA